MAITRREIIQGLKEERRALAEKLHACDMALRAYGIDPEGFRLSGSSLSSPRRVNDGAAVEAELERVLTEAGEPLAAADAYALGDFACRAENALRHAVRRRPERFEFVENGGRSLLALRGGTDA